MLELAPVAPHDVGAHLGAEPEAEAPAGRLLQLPCRLGGDHRAAGEGDGHPRSPGRGRRRRGRPRRAARYAVRPPSVRTRPSKPAAAVRRARSPISRERARAADITSTCTGANRSVGARASAAPGAARRGRGSVPAARRHASRCSPRTTTARGRSCRSPATRSCSPTSRPASWPPAAPTGSAGPRIPTCSAGWLPPAARSAASTSCSHAGPTPVTTLPRRHDLDGHPRVQRARAHRRGVEVYGDDDRAGGARRRARRPARAVRRALGVSTPDGGAGRRLIAAGLARLEPGEPCFAQVAPGNAASLRAFLAAGFVPIGSEVLLTPR